MTDVLDSITRDTAKRKGAALTPVGLEHGAVDMFNGRMPDMPTIFMPQELIEASVRTVREQAKAMLEACTAIEASLGKPVGAPTREQVEATVKQAEAAADAKWAAEYAAKQERAQAAAFAQSEGAEKVALTVSPTDYAGTWTCPTHGEASLEVLKSRKGRTYRACTDCDAFEK